MSNYIFEENKLSGITNVYHKRIGILLGFIHEHSKRFIYIFSPTNSIISNKIESFELQKQIDSYQSELDAQPKLFANKQKKKNLLFDIENNKKRLESLKKPYLLDVEDLSEELKGKGIEFISFNQGYALLPEEFNFNNTEELIKQRNLNHLWDMHYFNMYNLLDVKNYQEYLGTSEILTRSIMKSTVIKKNVEILNVTLDYNLFINDEDEKIKAIEKGLKLIMHDKEVFNATIELYSNMFVKFKSLVGIYRDMPFMIKDCVLFTSNTDKESFEIYSKLMFDISIYSKN